MVWGDADQDSHHHHPGSIASSLQCFGALWEHPLCQTVLWGHSVAQEVAYPGSGRTSAPASCGQARHPGVTLLASSPPGPFTPSQALRSTLCSLGPSKLLISSVFKTFFWKICPEGIEATG